MTVDQQMVCFVNLAVIIDQFDPTDLDCYGDGLSTFNLAYLEVVLIPHVKFFIKLGKVPVRCHLSEYSDSVCEPSLKLHVCPAAIGACVFNRPLDQELHGTISNFHGGTCVVGIKYRIGYQHSQAV